MSDVLNEVAGNNVSPSAARDPVMPMDIVASKPNATAAISAPFLTTEKRRWPSESRLLRRGLLLLRLRSILLFLFGLIRGRFNLIVDYITVHGINVDFMQAVRHANIKRIDQLALLCF